MRLPFAFLLTAATLTAGEAPTLPGRYQITTATCIVPIEGKLVTSSLLLDTASGQTWYLVAQHPEGIQWKPVPTNAAPLTPFHSPSTIPGTP